MNQSERRTKGKVKMSRAGLLIIVMTAALVVASGVALAYYGIKKGERWPLLTAFLSPVIAVAVALLLHFPYGIGTIGYLGLIYMDTVILLVGTVLAYVGLPERERWFGRHFRPERGEDHFSRSDR